MATDRPRILVVDDDPNAQSLLTQWLHHAGYETLHAHHGPGGLESAVRERPDAIVLDVNLPEIDGFEICRLLRKEPRTATTSILMMTAMADAASRVRGFDAGADDFVTKPVERLEFLSRLRSHLELGAARREVAQLQGSLATIRLISHEFNNPLQIVVGAVDLLTSEDVDQVTLSGEVVEMLREASDRLGELASRLVAISEPAYKNSPIGTMLDLEASR